MDRHAADVAFWARRLERGERLAWVGRPGWHLKRDWTALGLSLPAATAALGILMGSESKYVQVVTGMLGIPPIEDPQMVRWLTLAAVAALIYLAGFLFVFCVTSPLRTRYALTDRRALVHHRVPVPRLRAKRLTPATEIAWDGRDRGTILFDEIERDYGIKPKSRLGTAATVKTERTGFVRIEDAAHVHALMREVADGRSAA